MIVYKVRKVHKVKSPWTPAGRFAYGSNAADKYCPKDTCDLTDLMDLMDLTDLMDLMDLIDSFK